MLLGVQLKSSRMVDPEDIVSKFPDNRIERDDFEQIESINEVKDFMPVIGGVGESAFTILTDDDQHLGLIYGENGWEIVLHSGERVSGEEYPNFHNKVHEIAEKQAVMFPRHLDSSSDSRDDLEPIKISTLKQFKWCAIDSYIEHRAEIGDKRISLSEPTEAMERGTEIHGTRFGLYVTLQSETPYTDEALELAKNERTVATNYEGYQIQGTPDRVDETDDGRYRIVEMKTTTFDDEDWYRRYSIPHAAFQAKLYTWMLDIRGIPMDDPIVIVKQQDDPDNIWIANICPYDCQEVEEQLDFIFDKFENPEKLAQYRPADWKCENKNHWQQYKRIMDERGTTVGEQ